MKRLHPLAIGIVSVLLAACSAQSQDLVEDVMEGSSSSAVSSTVSVGERVLSGGILEIGSANAGVAMNLYVNHDSPYSRQFHAHMPMLQREFIESGDLKIRIIPVAFRKYTDSGKDAAMLLCAARQGRGLAMHGLLMTGTKTLLPAGTDKAAFDACVAQPSSAAVPAGITAVPTYDIEETRFTGVPTEADLVGSIKQAR